MIWLALVAVLVASFVLARGYRTIAEARDLMNLWVAQEEAEADEEEEGEEVGSPPWHLHFDSIAQWHGSDIGDREGIGDPLIYAIGEQADATMRHYLADHGIEEMLREDEWVAFTAYSIAEIQSMLLHGAVYQLQTRGALNLSKKRDRHIYNTLFATLIGSIQRITWHACQHVSGEQAEEPYGGSVSAEELPEMVVAEPERTIKKESE